VTAAHPLADPSRPWEWPADWAGRLNAAPERVALGPVAVDVYHWAEISATVANPPHRHTYFEVCWVRAGQGRFVVDRQAHPIGPGTLLFARPGVQHQIISDQPPGIGLVWIAFQLRLPPPPAAATGGDDPASGEPNTEVLELFRSFAGSLRTLAGDPHTQVATLWTALRQTAGGPALPGDREAARALTRALLVALAQAGADSLRPRPGAGDNTLAGSTHPAGGALGSGLVRQALRYVHDNLDRPLSVEELARHVHLSRRQLTRLFTDQAGSPPASYIERARLDHAAALLSHTAQPIKQIAAAVGYPDVSQFTRAFTRRTGTPPGTFRRQADPAATNPAPSPDRRGPDRQASDPATQ
jgi:AraC family L-rhamnose operon transcriptional activator RhaR